jgi:hypothetical protein
MGELGGGGGGDGSGGAGDEEEEGGGTELRGREVVDDLRVDDWD